MNMRVSLGKRLSKAIVLAVGIAAGNVCRAADILVVVHPENTTERLAAKDVKRIFLSKKSVYPDGTLAVPVDQKFASKIRDDFYLKVAAKAPPQMQTAGADPGRRYLLLILKKRFSDYYCDFPQLH